MGSKINRGGYQFGGDIQTDGHQLIGRRYRHNGLTIGDDGRIEE